MGVTWGQVLALQRLVVCSSANQQSRNTCTGVGRCGGLRSFLKRQVRFICMFPMIQRPINEFQHTFDPLVTVFSWATILHILLSRVVLALILFRVAEAQCPEVRDGYIDEHMKGEIEMFA